jgi:pyruvate-ferredoxin/flavodoxin oxidoreductase
MLANLEEGGTFLLTTPYDKRTKVWDSLPAKVQKQMIDKNAKFYIIDAINWAGLGLGPHQHDHADRLLPHLRHPQEGRGDQGHQGCHQKNLRQKRRKGRQHELRRVDAAINNIVEVKIPKKVTGHELPPTVPADAPDFVKNVTARMIEGQG